MTFIAGRRLPILLIALAALVLSLVGGPVHAQDNTGSPAATRSFSTPAVAPGGQLEVTIDVDNYGTLGGVVETLPPGFSYVSRSLSPSSVEVEGQEVKFVLFGESSFTYIVTASGTLGTYTFSGILKDENNVEHPVGGASSISVGFVPPSVSISRTNPGAMSNVRINSPIPLTATFSEPVFGFTVGDIIVTNGSAGNFVGRDGDSVYTFDVTPNAIGVVTVDIAADMALNADNIGNSAATHLSLGIPYDDDGNGTIEKSEVIATITDYLFGGEDEAISKADVIALITLYLFGPSTPHNPPGAPGGLTAAGNGQTRIDLSWNAPRSDGGAAITGYRIEVSEDRSNWTDLVANTGNVATTYSHTRLTAGTTRHYRVSAINSAGTGPTSNIATGITDTGSGNQAPDLVVDAPTVSSSTPDAGGTFTLQVTVRNQGNDRSGITYLHYYRSTDSTITAADTQVGTDDVVFHLDATESSDKWTDVTAPSTPGTYYYGACVDAVRDESDTDNNCSSGVVVAVGTPPAPDLVVGTPTVSDSNPEVGESFTLSATVRNQGSASSGSTTVRYYRSTDSSISSSDTAVGTDSVSGLSASGTSPESISVTAPSTAGTYYYGACVGSVSGESNTGNNCSSAVAVTVSATPDLVVDTPTVSDSSPEVGESFTLAATVENQGSASSGSTTLRYYRSADSTISSSDTAVGTDNVGGLNPSGTSPESISVTAPSTAGTYYYGACVDAVSGEANTANNCSSAVAVTVGGITAGDYDADNDGLIEVSNLTQLNAIRWDLDGDGESRESGYSQAFPGAVAGMGCPDEGCSGYELVSDLNFDTNGNGQADAGDAYWNDGSGWDPIDLRTTFDGGGHTITNIYINRSDQDEVGLFGDPFVSGVIIRNVGLVSVDVTGKSSVGGLVGDAHGINISDSYVTGSVSGVGAVGGLIGDSFRGTITNSYSTASVSGSGSEVGGLVGDSHTDALSNSHASGNVSGGDAIGGLVGDSFSGTIVASFATGNVNGDDYVGGLIGDSHSTKIASGYATGDVVATGDEIGGLIGDTFETTIIASYAAGDVTGNASVGGLVGNLFQGSVTAGYATGLVSGNADFGGLIGVRSLDPTINVSYWDSQTSGQSNSDGGIRKTTAELQSSTGYTGIFSTWNVDVDGDGSADDPWDFGTSSQYPVLKYGGLSVAAQRDTEVAAAAGPDLVVGTPMVTNSSPEVGESFTLAATVENQGSASSGSTTLRYYRSADSTISSSDTAVGTDNVGGLNPSGTSPESISVTAPSTAGTYYYGACVDAVSGESNTGNNCSSAVTVTVSAAPDLVVDTPTVSDSSPEVGESFTLSATVRNQGSASSGSTTLRYYRSAAFTISSSDTAVGTDSVSGLSASGTSPESISVTAPSTPGTYYYGACVDSVTGENDTDNNCSVSIAVTVGTAPAPDLVVGTPTVSDNSPEVGKSFTLAATVENQGSASSGSTTLRYYRSADSTISSSDTAVGTDNVGGLSASGTSPESISVTAPSTAGTYYYGACVDAVSGESNTGNNCSSAVTVTVSAAPDLVVDTPTVSDSSPEVGESFTLAATVENQGSASSGSTTLRYYLSADFTISSSDTAVGTDNVGGLNPSGTSPESISVTAPSTAGTYYYGACVDSVTGESDTTNNCSSAVTVTVQAAASAPDLVVGTPSVDDNSPTTGESFTLSATVSNQGSASSISTTLRYYRSTDSTISSSDTSAGTDPVSGLSASGTSDESISVTAPSTAGTYYYGACVDSVSGESNTGNNCSSAVAVTVSSSNGNTYGVGDFLPGVPTSGFWIPAVVSGADLSSSGGNTTITFANGGYIELQNRTRYTCQSAGGCGVNNGEVTKGTLSQTTSALASDLIVDPPSVDDSSPEVGESFTLSATVSNQGSASSGSTTLRYYRSADSSISSSDTAVGTDSVSGLSASGTSDESIDQTAPSTAGTYYYGACVDSVSGESDTTNNCSSAVTVTVQAAPVGAPDLVVGTPSVDDSSPTTGETFTLSATVRNQGSASSGSTTLRYYRSTDSSISSSDTAVGTDSVSGLSASGTSDESIDQTAPSTAGTYYYGACVDSVTGESDTTNNCSSGVAVAVGTPPAPDLVVDAPTVSENAPATGTTFTLSATVRNRGDGRSDFTDLRYYRSSDSTITSGDTPVGTDPVSRLNASASGDESISLTAPSTSGTYYYGACVDAVSGESDTNNNCSDAVAVTVVSAIPDLAIETPTVSDSSPHTGESFTLSVTVINQGNVRSDFTELRFYRSNDSTISSSDTQLGRRNRPWLDPSESEAVSIILKVPSSEGTYYFGACVDAVSGETDTANNCSAAVTVIVVTPISDLVVEVPTFSNSSPPAGTSLTLTVTVRNQGIEPSSSSTTLRYYRSDDSTITASDTPVGTDSVGTLDASGSSDESISLTAPTTPGTYYYSACVDTISGESDASNNCSLAVTLNVVEAIPDLVADTPTVSESRPELGDSFTLSVTVRNQGNVRSARTTLRYYRSTDSTITTADTSVGTDSVFRLDASASGDESISLTAPSTLGTYYYGACVDAVSGESNIDNNCSDAVEVVVVVPSGPDLAVEMPTVSKDTLEPGESFTLSVTVRNQGNAASGSTTLRYYHDSPNNQVDTSALDSLAGAGSNTVSITLTARSTPGSDYYKVCVDTVPGETNTDNNCSDRVWITVPDSIEYELTKCAITPGPDFDITIHVSLTAIRAVESVTIKGYVLNFGESPVEIGRKTIRNMAAGETVNTTVTGSVSEYYFQCAIEVDWD